jgi:Xaa-Pro aminopeptidase
MYERMRAGVPDAKLVPIDDMMEQVRAIKSAEEIQILRKAAALGDAMLTRCREIARPGVKECEVYADMRQAMLAGGGEEPTLFLWASDPQPLAHPFFFPSERCLTRGDVILTEIHPKYGGYCTHVERTFSLGDPDPKYRSIYEGCVEAYRTGLSLFGPGKKMSTAMEAVKETILGRGLGMCETGIHGHGLGSLEYPRYRHHAIRADQGAIKAIGDEFKPGMVFAFNIDLFDPKWKNGDTGSVFAETVLITDKGAERMHSYPFDFQALPA